MPWTPPNHTPYQWQNTPSVATPLDKAHLEAAEQDLVDYAKSLSSATITFVQQMESNVQVGATYTFALTDAGVVVVGNRATAQTFTIPTFASIALPVNTVLSVLQYGVGQITLAGAGGVTLRVRSGNAAKTFGQYSLITAWQFAQDEWVLGGDLA